MKKLVKRFPPLEVLEQGAGRNPGPNEDGGTPEDLRIAMDDVGLLIHRRVLAASAGNIARVCALRLTVRGAGVTVDRVGAEPSVSDHAQRTSRGVPNDQGVSCKPRAPQATTLRRRSLNARLGSFTPLLGRELMWEVAGGLVRSLRSRSGDRAALSLWR
jgi:hypothetical protein